MIKEHVCLHLDFRNKEQLNAKDTERWKCVKGLKYKGIYVYVSLVEKIMNSLNLLQFAFKFKLFRNVQTHLVLKRQGFLNGVNSIMAVTLRYVCKPSITRIRKECKYTQYHFWVENY